MQYKKDIYDNYVDIQSRRLYGKITAIGLEADFPRLEYHYKKFLPKEKIANILDVGCGEGGFIYWLQTLGYLNLKGVDISLQQVEAARTLGLKNVFCEDLKITLSQGAKYDLIIARDILEHFRKDEVVEILDLSYNSLNPGGCLLLQVPNGMGLFYTEIFYGDFTHENAYTTSSLTQILSKAGFENVCCFPVSPAPLGVKSTIRRMLWSLYISWVKTLKSLETGNRDGIFTRNLICYTQKN